MSIFLGLTDIFLIDCIFERYTDYTVRSADFVIILFPSILSKTFQAFLDTNETFDEMPIDIFVGKNLLQTQ